MGETKVICQVRAIERRCLLFSEIVEGMVTANIQMLPRATQTRSMRESVSGKVGEGHTKFRDSSGALYVPLSISILLVKDHMDRLRCHTGRWRHKDGEHHGRLRGARRGLWNMRKRELSKRYLCAIVSGQSVVGIVDGEPDA